VAVVEIEFRLVGDREGDADPGTEGVIIPDLLQKAWMFPVIGLPAVPDPGAAGFEIVKEDRILAESLGSEGLGGEGIAGRPLAAAAVIIVVAQTEIGDHRFQGNLVLEIDAGLARGAVIVEFIGVIVILVPLLPEVVPDVDIVILRAGLEIVAGAGLPGEIELGAVLTDAGVVVEIALLAAEAVGHTRQAVVAGVGIGVAGIDLELVGAVHELAEGHLGDRKGPELGEDGLVAVVAHVRVVFDVHGAEAELIEEALAQDVVDGHASHQGGLVDFGKEGRIEPVGVAVADVSDIPDIVQRHESARAAGVGKIAEGRPDRADPHLPLVQPVQGEGDVVARLAAQGGEGGIALLGLAHHRHDIVPRLGVVGNVKGGIAEIVADQRQRPAEAAVDVPVAALLLHAVLREEGALPGGDAADIDAGFFQSIVIGNRHKHPRRQQVIV